MKKPDTPAKEAERLCALRAYGILDTPPEAAFDALTRLAARALDVPIALVSLVDAERQWFKSRHGLDATETSRDVSFCGHTVVADAPLIVADAHEDERFADNPLVSGEPHIRFYAGVPLRSPDGHVLGTLCAIDRTPRDVSGDDIETLSLIAVQVQAQLELRQAARRHRAEQFRLVALLESMQEGVVVQRKSGEISDFNGAALEILGLSEDQLRGRTSMDPRWASVREDGSDYPGTEHPAMKVLATEQRVRGAVMGIKRADGTQRWISINGEPLLDADGTLIAALTTFRDVTDERRAVQERAKLRVRVEQHERLVTTGTLAAGVGHELNNPLTFVIANLDYALEELSDVVGGSPSSRMKALIEVLTEGRQGAERIRRIVQGLRAFARPAAGSGPVELREAIESSANMAMHELRQKCVFLKELQPVPAVLADEARLSQVLVNLFVNAAQAFEANDPERNRVVVRTLMAGDRVAVEVSDNGPGIPEDVLPRIWDPFFTTKDVGVGTGLGLSICHNIVTALGGELTCESSPGEGATFRIVLPIAEHEEIASAPDERVMQARRGRILIVDDEDGVRRALTRLLQGAHHVESDSDSRAALRRMQQGQQFDLVITDLMMPYLDGIELYRRVRSERVEQAERFVFMTGGVREERMRAFLADVPNETLEKPIEAAVLRRVVRRFVRGS